MRARRTDNTELAISWCTCCSGKAHTVKANLESALRHAISSQIIDYRQEHLNEDTVCMLCGSSTFIHVDHFPLKFREIRDTFLKDNVPPTEFADEPKHNWPIFRAEDKVFEEKWASFHRAQAAYRLICKKCNTKKENK